MPRVPPQNAAGFLQFLDVSVGAEVAALCTVPRPHFAGTPPQFIGTPPPSHRDPPPKS